MKWKLLVRYGTVKLTCPFTRRILHLPPPPLPKHPTYPDTADNFRIIGLPSWAWKDHVRQLVKRVEIPREEMRDTTTARCSVRR
jgi:hypothetical protein